MSRIAVVFGTRPEVIKLFPVIAALRALDSNSTLIVNTGQHREMCDQALSVFGITPDISLELMSKNQSPVDILAKGITLLAKTFQENAVGSVVVQGDTTTALAAALAASYCKIPVAHVEAGLRTFDKANPFPEETNRLLISQLATLHFAPTKRSAENLMREGIEQGVFVTGNTVVDSVNWVQEQIDRLVLVPDKAVTELIATIPGKILLVTGHRREHFDQPIRNLCKTLGELLAADDSLHVVYPVHLNPNIQQPVFEILGNTPRCHLLPPLDYPSMVHLMKHSSLIITDSGGIQEEAPSFATPVIVTRKVTERSEALESGAAILVSLEEPQKLHNEIVRLLQQSKKDVRAINPFGTGQAGIAIAKILLQK